MTKRYYYDCPIEAMYMAKNFGVEFDSFAFDDNDVIYSIINGKLKLISPEVEKIYVSPESEHIFEHKKGDLCEINSSIGFIHIIGMESLYISFNGMVQDLSLIKIKNISIIERNNKHFFMPKVEEIDV